MRQKEVNIAGLGVFHGDIDADLVKCSGMGKALGNIDCRRMEVAGVFTAGGKIRAEEVDVKGLFKSKADFSAERFTVMGAVVIDALLNAGNIDIQFEHTGRIREIGGENVSIRPVTHGFRRNGGRVFANIISAFPGRGFKVGTIEGNSIYLENVEVETVRGQDVTIGPNCRIGYLEYSSKAKVHDSSYVTDMKGQKQDAGGF